MLHSKNKKKTTSGFTIVELLTVIVVIAVLAAIVIVAYNGVQLRAKSSAVITGLKNTDKALRLYATDTGLGSWPADNAAVSGVAVNPTVQQFINGTSLKDFMKKAPQVDNSPSLYWFYDNGSRYSGTNIIIINITQEVADSIDESIDDGDETCGKIRYDPSNQYFFYSLSYSSGLSDF